MTLLFKPLSGLLHQEYIPLRFCPISIELSLVYDITEPSISTNAVAPSPILADKFNFYAYNMSLGFPGDCHTMSVGFPKGCQADWHGISLDLT